jgi:hypothetical protein
LFSPTNLTITSWLQPVTETCCVIAVSLQPFAVLTTIISYKIAIY